VLLLAAPTVSRAQCLTDTNDVSVGNLLGYVRMMMTNPDAHLIYTRDSLYHLQPVPVTQVTLVSDNRTCKKALTAVNRDPSNANLQRAHNVVVVRAGTSYVVTDPAVKAGEFGVTDVLDRRFKVIGRIIG
jgi:hypothetical protein